MDNFNPSVIEPSSKELQIDLPSLPIDRTAAYNIGTMKFAADNDNTLIQSCFRLITESEYNIAPLVLKVTYKYKPKEVTVVLADVRQSNAPNAIFNWIKHLQWKQDNITLRTLDKQGNAAYENKFLGCRLKDHSCDMDYESTDTVKHIVTVSYEHFNVDENPTSTQN